MSSSNSTVWIVGSGPGDPELMTVKAQRLLHDAGLVVFDEDVQEAVLATIPGSASKLMVPRSSGDSADATPIRMALPMMLESARHGRSVVRLTSGDPTIFSRTAEEFTLLREAGFAPQLVPGITAGLGAAASLGVALTQRWGARSVTFASAASGKEEKELIAEAKRWPLDTTLVLYIGLRRMENASRALLRAGWAPTTPVAVVSHATTSKEQSLRATLGTLEQRLGRAKLDEPALLVVGAVVGVASPG